MLSKEPWVKRKGRHENTKDTKTKADRIGFVRSCFRGFH